MINVDNVRDHSVYALSQWETVLHYNISHWLGAYSHILRKFSDLYGLIWVCTLIWNSPFHPIRILFKSIRFLYGGKVNKDVKFPPKISFTKSTEGKSHPMIMRATGPHFVENTYLSLRWPLHMVNQIFHQYLWRYLQQKVAYSVNTWHENIMTTRLPACSQTSINITLP